MKNRMITAVICALLSCGCTLKSTRQDLYQSAIDTYETYYTEVLGNGHYTDTCDYFTLSYEMTQVEGDGYRYYVILDDPTIAMYNVMMIAVENAVPYEQCETMVPSFGIFEDRVSLVPGQVNYEAGFVRGISISGESDEDHMDLLILVKWKCSDGTPMSAYIQHSLSLNGEEQ